MKFKKTEIITLLCIVLAIAGAVFLAFKVTVDQKHESSDAGQTLRVESSDAAFVSLDGEPFSFDVYRNQVRVVNIWATWTPFSKDELLILNEVSKAYQEDEVVFIAINRMEESPRVKSYLERLGSLQNIVFVQDKTDVYYTRVDGFAMPETIVYDRAGNIVTHIRGPVSKETLQAEIETALRAE